MLRHRGSSPLTRGKHPSEEAPTHALRLIPAHAGKTRRGTTVRDRIRAHPRSRGENNRAKTSLTASLGSSPLTRGKPRLRRLQIAPTRLIPAHAGKTDNDHEDARRNPAHPRSRGENSPPSTRRSPRYGSSPLTRGKRNRPRRRRKRKRLIPAHAGKTPSWRPLRLWPRAHPRSRGENICSPCMPSALSGSSPLTRGKRIAKIAKRRLGRLIPAHAGKTLGFGGGLESLGAHPRSRGENGGRVAGLRGLRGSSPLTRGKPFVTPVRSAHRRLIPAHAGKTAVGNGVHFGVPAHPRSRGENWQLSESRSAVSGSSPLTRGKRSVVGGDLVGDRLIPAHAGKTVAAWLACAACAAHPRSRGENVQRPPTCRGRGGLIPAHAGKTAWR